MPNKSEGQFEENCYRLIETEKDVIILIDTSKMNHISSWNLAKVISLISETEKKGKKARILISENQERLKRYLFSNRTADAEVV